MTDMQNQQPEEVTVVAKESVQQISVPETEAQTENDIKLISTTTTLENTAVLIKTPRADSKLILQNMEEVLKSVKKKHRAKHKRKRELKKLALLEAAAAEKLAVEGNMKKHHNKKPLQVAALENAAATSTQHNNSILQHFSRTPKKQQQQQTVENEDVQISTLDIEVLEEPKRKTNAFEVMMNARNKSIGGNSPGKDASLCAEDVALTLSASKRNAAQLKCKEILQNWAERKGAGKRKLDEEARAAFVEQQLENRAKRLKHMLEKSSTPKNKSTPEINGKRRTRAQNVADKEEEKEKEKKEEEIEENENSIIIENTVRKKSKNNKVEETPKRKTRRNSTTTTIIVDEDIATNTRPKRSCVIRKRVDVSLIETTNEETIKTRSSSGKSKANNSKLQENGVQEEISEDEIELIEISEIDTSGDKNTPKRLAPLFMRSLQKPKHSPDPILVQARRNFLHSGVPEKLLLEQTRQKQYQQQCVDSYQLFPTISHINQLEEKDNKICDILQKPIKLMSNSQLDMDLENIKLKTHKFGLLLTNCTTKELSKIKNQTLAQRQSLKIAQCRCNNPLSCIPGKRLVAKAWKLTHERFPTFKCYNQLREKYRYFSALDSAQDVQQVSESLVVTRLAKHASSNNNNNINNNNNNNDNSNDEFSQPPAAAPNGELLFTEKYKPLLFEQILVNLTPVMQLREFLANFSQKRNNNANSDSDIETDQDSNSNAANMPQNGNTVVLLGPCASGKTNAVFALANEFNFNVLEINAGMKRTGKRLLQELHEATQSHQIRKERRKQSTLNGKHKSRVSQSNVELENTRRCLILIEDADIAFEQTDAGFVDAIYTLASVSKRPVIIVASNPNCAHLQRLIQQHTIKFALPHAVSISRYMSLLSLIENCPTSIDDIVSLYLYNGMDVRRTLLELQLFVQSGGDLKRYLMESPQRDAQTATQSRYTASPTKLEHLHKGREQENATEGKRLDEPVQTTDQAVKNLYTHRSLFDFYTLDQNAMQKIPYPVDFDLLSNNLNELLQKSTIFMKKLSPKKAWLSTSLHASQGGKKRGGQNKQQNTLCDFFEQLSAAVLIDAQDQRRTLLNSEFSELTPRRLSSDLTHTLVERAIEVNLCPESMPYNLFQTTKLSKNTLSEYLNITPLRGNRACALDWDPIMRNICRFEQQRSNDERRSMRFYHYLRGSCANVVNKFSSNHFDHVCSIFQDDINDDKEQINQAA